MSIYTSAKDVKKTILKRDEGQRVNTQMGTAQSNIQSKSNKMNLLDLFGSGAGALALTSLGPLGLALGAGLGSYIGQSIGGKRAERKFDKLEEGKLYRDQTRDIQDSQSAASDALDDSRFGKAASRAFSAYTLGNTEIGKQLSQDGIGSVLNEFGQTLPDRISRFKSGFAQNPLIQAISNVGTNISNRATLAQDAVISADNANKMLQLGGTALDAIGPNVSGDPMGRPPEGAVNVLRDLSPDATLPAFAGYSGTANQNTLLAQALGFDPSQSLVDQLKSTGLSSDMQNRADLFESVMNPNQLVGPTVPSPQSIAGNYLGLPMANYRQGMR